MFKAWSWRRSSADSCSRPCMAQQLREIEESAAPFQHASSGAESVPHVLHARTDLDGRATIVSADGANAMIGDSIICKWVQDPSYSRGWKHPWMRSKRVHSCPFSSTLVSVLHCGALTAVKGQALFAYLPKKFFPTAFVVAWQHERCSWLVTLPRKRTKMPAHVTVWDVDFPDHIQLSARKLFAADGLPCCAVLLPTTEQRLSRKNVIKNKLTCPGKGKWQLAVRTADVVEGGRKRVSKDSHVLGQCHNLPQQIRRRSTVNVVAQVGQLLACSQVVRLSCPGSLWDSKHFLCAVSFLTWICAT